VEPQVSDLPRVASVEFSPPRVTTVCPIAIRMQFDDPGGEVRRVVGHWIRHRRQQLIAADYESVEVPPRAAGASSTGKVALEAHHQLPGWYEHHVYVEDAAGRKSKVLTAGITVDAQPLFPRAKCAEGRERLSLGPTSEPRTRSDGVSSDVPTPTAVAALRGAR
jgi:hypothetical protein